MKKFPPGFTVALISPSGPMPTEKFDAGVSALKALGAEINIMPNARNGAVVRGYLAAPAADRAADIECAWCSGSTDLIVASRGGYGSAGLLPLLDWEKLSKYPMTLAGFSDVTALHWAMAAKNCGRILCAPMLNYLSSDPDIFSLDKFFEALQNIPQKISLLPLRGTRAAGKPLPGNLTVAASLAGTPYFPDLSGRIVMLEDVREAPYRIDRMLTQLRLGGNFDNAAAVVFGSFTDCGDENILREIFAEFAGFVKCPVFTGLPFGHRLPFYSISSEQIWEIS